MFVNNRVGVAIKIFLRGSRLNSFEPLHSEQILAAFVLLFSNSFGLFLCAENTCNGEGFNVCTPHDLSVGVRRVFA